MAGGQDFLPGRKKKQSSAKEMGVASAERSLNNRRSRQDGVGVEVGRMSQMVASFAAL